jgi:hypothetical protein
VVKVKEEEMEEEEEDDDEEPPPVTFVEVVQPLNVKTEPKPEVVTPHLPPVKPSPVSKPVPKPVSKPVPKPIPAVEPQRVENKMQLPEYCLGLPLNFHPGAIDTMVRHMHGRNRDTRYEPKILLVTGKPGIGKTFCVERACKTAGYEMVYIDMMHTDLEAHMRDAIIGKPDPYGPYKNTKIRVAVVDAMDGLERSYLDKVAKFIQNMTDPYGSVRGKEKRKIAIRFRVNMIILTTSNRYDKKLMSWMYRLKPTEIKINPINHSQTITLARKACEYQGLPLDQRVHKFIMSFGENLTSLLMKIQFLSYGSGVIDHDMMRDDDTAVDIFTCCRYLMEPPEERNPETGEEKTVSFEKYNRMWDRGGEKVQSTIFHSYQDYVPFIPETPGAVKKLLTKNPADRSEADVKAAERSMTDYKDSGDYFYKGLAAMSEIANAFSDLDSIPFQEFAAQGALQQCLRLRLKVSLEDIRIRAIRKRRIDVKTRFPAVKNTNCFAACGIDTRRAEMMHMLNVMHNLDVAKKLKDMNHEMNPHYELSEHIGRYLSLHDAKKNQWVIMDMYPERPDEPMSKKKKMPKMHPKLEAIAMFSHEYSSGNNQEALSKTTAKVKLASGKFVGRRRKAK